MFILIVCKYTLLPKYQLVVYWSNHMNNHPWSRPMGWTHNICTWDSWPPVLLKDSSLHWHLSFLKVIFMSLRLRHVSIISAKETLPSALHSSSSSARCWAWCHWWVKLSCVHTLVAGRTRALGRELVEECGSARQAGKGSTSSDSYPTDFNRRSPPPTLFKLPKGLNSRT